MEYKELPDNDALGYAFGRRAIIKLKHLSVVYYRAPSHLTPGLVYHGLVLVTTIGKLWDDRRQYTAINSDSLMVRYIIEGLLSHQLQLIIRTGRQRLEQ